MTSHLDPIERQQRELCREFDAWCLQQGFPRLPGDDPVVLNLLNRELRRWLAAFVTRWSGATDGIDAPAVDVAQRLDNLHTWLVCCQVGSAAKPAPETVQGWIDALAQATATSAATTSAESEVLRELVELKDLKDGMAGRAPWRQREMQADYERRKPFAWAAARAALAARPVAQADAGALTDERIKELAQEADLAWESNGALFTSVREDVDVTRRLLAFARAALAASAQATQPDPEFCPYCDGSGESTALDGGGPDAQEVSITCPHCRGAQTLLAAYNTLAEDRNVLHLKAAQLGIFHSHATRYGWAPNQKDAMQSFEKLAAEWLAENGAQARQAVEPDNIGAAPAADKGETRA